MTQKINKKVESYFYTGFYDSESISSGFLLSVYSSGNEYFFHTINSELEIVDYHKFDENEIVDEIHEVYPIIIKNNECFITYKYENKIFYGRQSEIKKNILEKIENNEINSQSFIENFNNIFLN